MVRAIGGGREMKGFDNQAILVLGVGEWEDNYTE